MFHDEIFAQFPPLAEHPPRGAVRILVEKRLAAVGRAFKEGCGLALHVGLPPEEARLDLVAACLYVRKEGAVTRIGHVGHPVAHPERRFPGEGDAVGCAFGETFGHRRRAAIDGGVGRRVGVVVGDPEDASHRVGQPRAHLGHKGEARLLGRDGPLVEVFLAVHFPCQGSRAVGGVVRACPEVFPGIEGRAFVVVAHAHHDVMHRERSVGLYVEGHRGAGL